MASNEKENNAAPSSFLGRGWSFPPVFSRGKGGIEMSSDEDDIRESLTILFSTAIGERFREPKYGCNLENLSFEPVSTTLKTYLKGLIEQAVLHFEPRVDLNDVAIEVNEAEEGRVDIIVDYTVRITNSRYNMVYPFYQSEGKG